MRIYLDDIREPETSGWSIVRTAHEAMVLIRNFNITEISFDHDLGDLADNLTGYDVAKYIEERCYNGIMKCPKWNVHSANPVGRKNIESAMKAAELYSKEKK